MKKIFNILMVLFVCLSLFGCSKKQQDDNIEETQTEAIEDVDNQNEESISYPIVFSNDEMKGFISKYSGEYQALEFPYLYTHNDGYVGYYLGHCFSLNSNNDEEYFDRFTYESRNEWQWGGFGQINSVSQIDEHSFALDVTITPSEYEDSERYKKYSCITKITLVDEKEEDNLITLTFNDNNVPVDYTNDAGFDYYDWLNKNEYARLESLYEFSNGKKLSIREAKDIIEDTGFVFDTDYSEDEFDNNYIVDYYFIIEGKHIKPSSYGDPVSHEPVKKGTTVFVTMFQPGTGTNN